MSTKAGGPDLRSVVIKAAEQANVPFEDVDRAQILGQIAWLVAAHPKVAGRIAFKGGAIMHLVDSSPRLSRDIDGAMVVKERVSEKTIREALGTPAARRVVIRVDKMMSETSHSIAFPVVVCHPTTGRGEIGLKLEINWLAPLLLKAEVKLVTINGREISIPVVARLERAAEKVRAFLVRGRPGDAFDLYYNSTRLSKADRDSLPGLVAVKLHEDGDVPSGPGLRARFDKMVAKAGSEWTTGGIVIMGGRPPWSNVEPAVVGFKYCIPDRKP
jgi:predicted nucleotidyltransferase component of viral defense system